MDAMAQRNGNSNQHVCPQCGQPLERLDQACTCQGDSRADVWPPSPGTAPAPVQSLLQARTIRPLTRYVMMDVLLGTCAGLVSWPLLTTLPMYIFGHLHPVDVSTPEVLAWFWVVLALISVAYLLLCLRYRVFSVTAVCTTLLVWMPVIMSLAPWSRLAR